MSVVTDMALAVQRAEEEVQAARVAMIAANKKLKPVQEAARQAYNRFDSARDQLWDRRKELLKSMGISEEAASKTCREERTKEAMEE